MARMLHEAMPWKALSTLMTCDAHMPARVLQMCVVLVLGLELFLACAASSPRRALCLQMSLDFAEIHQLVVLTGVISSARARMAHLKRIEHLSRFSIFERYQLELRIVVTARTVELELLVSRLLFNFLEAFLADDGFTNLAHLEVEWDLMADVAADEVLESRKLALSLRIGRC